MYKFTDGALTQLSSASSSLHLFALPCQGWPTSDKLIA